MQDDDDVEVGDLLIYADVFVRQLWSETSFTSGGARGKIRAGEMAVVLEVKNDYIKIVSQKCFSGYIRKKYFLPCKALE